jgi:hypothetical protein
MSQCIPTQHNNKEKNVHNYLRNMEIRKFREQNFNRKINLSKLLRQSRRILRKLSR